MAEIGTTPDLVSTWTRIGRFASLSEDAQKRLLAGGRLRRFAPGGVLIRQGEAGDVAFVIKAGRVRIERALGVGSGTMTLAILGSGQLVGETAVLQRTPRNATVRAMEELEVIEIPGDLLREVVLSEALRTAEPIRYVEDVRPPHAF